MKEITEKQKNKEVQKLQRYDIFELLLNSDKEDQILMLKMLVNELQLTNIVEAKELLNKSYNGVKNHCETIQIGKKTFSILKGNV